MITDNFVWKTITNCFMCKRGKGIYFFKTNFRNKSKSLKFQNNNIVTKTMLSVGLDPPDKKALDSLPSNGISDDGTRMVAAVSPLAVMTDDNSEVSKNMTVGEIESSCFQTQRPGSSERLPPIAPTKELDVERIELREETDSNNTLRLPPIHQHLPPRPRASAAVTVSVNVRPRSSGPYARISFIQEQRALASVNYKRDRLEAI
ncbi:hypothetical protein PENTCL1PPCAC_7516, partial [Pristionchus entomophagus]